MGDSVGDFDLAVQIVNNLRKLGVDVDFREGEEGLPHEIVIPGGAFPAMSKLMKSLGSGRSR